MTTFADPPASLLPGLVLSAALLRGTDLVVLDVETTGWLADADRITEIGAVRISACRPPAEFCSLVNPGTPIPQRISDLTGITDAMVADAPVIGEVLPSFLEFTKGSVIAAHNARFDIGFLAAACEASGLPWPSCPVIDTADLSRLVLSRREVPDHKLATLADHFGAATAPRHRALADARATLGVLTSLLDRQAATMSRRAERRLRQQRMRTWRRLWSRRLFSSRLMSRGFRRPPRPSPR
jgi:DNA polymerase-3 subunit epsilon